MTTSAAIAPSTSTFSISLGRGGRFSASGKSSDLTGGVSSTADDDGSSSPQDSGSSDGSSFDSVLHEVYSSQTSSQTSQGSSQTSQGDEAGDSSSDTASVDGKSNGASDTTATMLVLPVTRDGTKRTLTSSTSGASIPTVAGKNDGPSNTTASTAAAQVPAPAVASTFIPTPVWTPVASVNRRAINRGRISDLAKTRPRSPEPRLPPLVLHRRL